MKNFYIESVKGRHSAEVFHAMFCIYALLDRSMVQYFKKFELSPVKFNVLMLLNFLGNGKGLMQNDICHHMIVSPSNITRLLDRMDKEGLVKRTPSPEDRRANLVLMTDKGKELLNTSFYGYGEKVQELVYTLNRDDVVNLSGLLIKWFEELEKKKENEGLIS
ncbi:MAG: MarR family transcriptional regulator [Candidatus Omnitrophica bacterium]|nr:MarR family transcriptional regulator [Candidatus Omnitrophota bacterium]